MFDKTPVSEIRPVNYPEHVEEDQDDDEVNYSLVWKVKKVVALLVLLM